jgi:hypothetical protein
LASRTQLDASRRLTGVAPDAAVWRRQAATAPENRRTAFLQDLLQGLGELSSAARGGADVTRQLGVLAEFAVRIDADSSTLRQLAADLQHLADVWPTLANDGRLRALDPIVDAATREARQALEDAPLAAPGTGERR